MLFVFNPVGLQKLQQTLIKPLFIPNTMCANNMHGNLTNIFVATQRMQSVATSTAVLGCRSLCRCVH